jgi:hypothetical protein
MEWRTIDGFPNYEVSSTGLVLSHNTGGIMSPLTHHNGYLSVMLSNQLVGMKRIGIHRIVATSFLENPENKPEVDHINRDKTDNRLENLRWATRSENVQNTGIRSDNTTGYKYISYNEKSQKYMFQKKQGENSTWKSFVTLDEAIKFRDEFLKSM